MEIGGGIGAAFFLGMFGTAIASDISRNWGKSERELDWNPLLFWRVFLYFISLMFAAAGIASHRQGWWLSLEFGVFAALCWLGAGGIGGRVRLPKRAESSVTTAVRSGHEPQKRHWAGDHLHEGFVAMEYFALILNRSYLVFITEEGLRGWRFRGVVSSLEPTFYQDAEALLDDPDLAEGSPAFEELMQQRHGFFLHYADIDSVEFVDRQKWGMGGVPHVGKLVVRIRLRRTREFILLGSAHGQVIRNTIVSRMGGSAGQNEPA